MKVHSVLWLMVLVLMLVIAPLVVAPQQYRALVDAEVAEAERWYGEEELSRIAEISTNLYDLLFVDTGVDGLFSHYAQPRKSVAMDEAPRVIRSINTQWDPAQKRFVERSTPVWVGNDAIPIIAEKAQTAAAPFLGYWKGLLMNLYLMCWRAAHFVVWVVYLVPFLVAIVIDGILVRRVKLASFRYTSPTLYNLSWHSIIGLFAAAVVGSALIVAIPVLVYPGVVASIGILARLLIGNIQHSA